MRYFFAVLLFTLITACTSTSHLQRIAHEADELLLVLDQREISANPAFEAPYDHPAEIAPADLEKILTSIQVKPDEGMLMSFFSEKKRTRLFNSKTVSQTASELSKALALANPLEKVDFYQMSPLDEENVSVTSGFLLVKGGQLHLRIDRYNVPLLKGRHPSRAGLGLKPSEEGKYAFALAEGKQMTHRTYKNVFGLPASEAHWLVIDYADFPDQVLEPGTAPVSTEVAPLTLEERLRTLKHLRDEGLITEEDYTEKKKTLLKDF